MKGFRFFLMLLALPVSVHAHSAILAVDASSFQSGFAPSAALDQNPTTAWCAAQTPTSTAPVTLDGESFGDWWEVELSDATVGAIHMKSGLPTGESLAGHKIRNFVWAYQLQNQSDWHKIAETNLYANRYQLILRFKPVAHISRIRLLIRKRDSEERKVLGANNPCLREVAFHVETDAKITTAPWFYAVSTWEEGANTFAPLKHWDWRTFRIEGSLQKTIAELNGKALDPDTFDEMWAGEMAQATWLTLEPKPTAFLFSGNYKDYDQVNPETFAGFYNFVRTNYNTYPMFGACGGHQLLAMAFTHETFQEFRSEFATDNMDQTVVTCATNPAYKCGNRSAQDCCYEGGAVEPFKPLVPNVPGLAIPNAYQTPRVDMLLNLLPPHAGFTAYLYHSDYVNPAKIAPRFDLIATYPAHAAVLSHANPSLVQAMKLKNYPVYGSQFHFDENQAGNCDRQAGYRDMDRVLKNFALIAMNQFNRKEQFKLAASHNQTEAGNLVDLDRSSLWCSGPTATGAQLTFEFTNPTDFKQLVSVEGENAAQALKQSYDYEYSTDGTNWTALPAHHESLYAAQHAQQQTCEKLTGTEDHQSFLTTFDKPAFGRFFRMTLHSSEKSVCLRELMLLKI